MPVNPNEGRYPDMDPAAFVTHIRDHYVDQFRAFVEVQRQSCARGGPEVKL